MSSPIHASSLFGSAFGALQQLINELSARVAMPIGPLPDAPLGDLLEPRGRTQRDGADAVERLLDRLTGRTSVDPQLARPDRPLLATTTVDAAGRGSVTRLVIRASAPGADWGVTGREAGMVAVYVDGRYRSTIIVRGERDEPHELTLGELAAGPHVVELRAATDIAPVRASIEALRVRDIDGEQALIDRYAPILELRDDDPSTRASAASNDSPMLLVPAVTRHPDGSRTIEYRVVFSNEDGGTRLPDLYARYGRGVDAEPVLRVELAPDGRLVSERYQAALHRWLPFDGARDGTRAVLRVSTANNLVSARTSTRTGERWADAPTAPVTQETGEYDVMRLHPWTWRVMAAELLREGKAAAADAVRGAAQIADPRRYVYLGSLSDAARAAISAAGGLELVLADGSRIMARIARGFATGTHAQSALELPVGAVVDAIRGVGMLGVRATVLDDLLTARELASAA